MKKKLILPVVTLLSATFLASCGESIPEIEKGAFSYLNGYFVGKNSSLKVDGDDINLMFEGKTSKLIPSKVTTKNIAVVNEKGEFTENKSVLAVEFAKTYNLGTDYLLYADLYNQNDGFVHLDKKVGDSYTSYLTFQPDLAPYAGFYSGYGNSDIYNVYYILDSDFDFGRGTYPFSQKFYNSENQESFFSGEYIYGVGRLREGDKENEVVNTIEMYDADDYGYGEYVCTFKDGLPFLDDGFGGLVVDEGVFKKLSVFDGSSTLDVDIIPLAPIDKTIYQHKGTFNFCKGAYKYEVKADEKGVYLDTTFDGETGKVTMGSHYFSVEKGNKTSYYVHNSYSSLVGNFSDGETTIAFTAENKLTINGNEVAYTPKIVNRRKGLEFVSGGKTYLVAPDLDQTSIFVSINGETQYFISREKFTPMFTNTFYVKSENKSLSFVINEDFTYSMEGKTGKAQYSFTHGDKFPSVILGDYVLKIVQGDVGYFELISKDNKREVVYSKTYLDKLYGEYSSNGQDSLTFVEGRATKDGQEVAYYFSPKYHEGTGTYSLGMNIGGEEYYANFTGTLIGTNKYFVKKEIFAQIAGVYSYYGKFGLENITFKEDGTFLLDMPNKEGTGLDKDVETSYQLFTVAEGSSMACTACLTYEYKGYILFVYFQENYVSIANLNYYKQDMVLASGTYVSDDLSTILYFQGSNVYLNGSKMKDAKISSNNGKVEISDSSKTITLEEKAGSYVATLKEGEITTSLARKLTYTDLDKFVGTYEVDGKTVSITKDANSYEYTFIANGSNVVLSSVYTKIYNGTIALVVPAGFSGNFVLSINLSTFEVTPYFEGSSLPPLPPPPPAPSL